MLKLIYFKMRALAEAPQMLMQCYQVDYQYVMSWDHFDDHWSNVKPLIPFKQLPILELNDGTQIGQSIAILNYIESVAGIEIADPAKAAEASSILQSAQELFAPLNPTVNFAIGYDFETKRLAMKSDLESRFSDLERYLNKYEGKYFIDDTPRAAEFALFHHLDLSKKLDPDILSDFPRLSQFIEDVASIKALAEYMQTRPELVDVGAGPKLIINGVAHPTGLQKT
jgi:glutathione S-transferase